MDNAYLDEWYDVWKRHGQSPAQRPDAVDRYQDVKDGRPSGLPSALEKDLQNFSKKWGQFEEAERRKWQAEQAPQPKPQAPQPPMGAMQPNAAPMPPPPMDAMRPAMPAPQQPMVSPTLGEAAQQPPPSAPPPQRSFAQPQLKPQTDPWADFVTEKPSAAADPWADFVKAKETAFDEKPLSWSDVPGQALMNLPSSAANFAKNVVEPFLSPVETATNLADVAAGGLRAGAKAILPERIFSAIDGGTPEATARIEGKANAVGQFFKDRYGSAEGLKRTLASDPVGAAGDAAAVLTGGGAALTRAPGLIGQAGPALQRAGSVLDPLTNVARAAKATGSGTAAFLGTTTGAGDRPIREAFKAGQAGSQAFVDNMRGVRPVSDVVDLAENAVNQMGRERSNAYSANMAKVKADQTQISMAPVRQAINDAADKVMFKGITKNDAAADIVTLMEKKYNEFLNLPAAERTAEALDALKQSLGEIYKDTKQGTMARTVAGDIFNSVKGEIVKQVPEYAGAMRDYANASDAIGEMRRTLSVNDRAATDTTLRKLQSTMRNNVNTNYGQRTKLLDDLSRFEPELPAALAGQSLNSLAPRGLARISPAAVVAQGMSSMNPATLALLPMTSPRLMGEASYAAGRVAGGIRDGGARFGATGGGAKTAGHGAYAASIDERAQAGQRQKDAGSAVEIAKKTVARNLDFSQGRPIVDTVKRLAKAGAPRQDIIRELSQYQSGRNVTPAQVAALDEIISKLLQAPRKSVMGLN